VEISGDGERWDHIPVSTSECVSEGKKPIPGTDVCCFCQNSTPCYKVEGYRQWLSKQLNGWEGLGRGQEYFFSASFLMKFLNIQDFKPSQG